MENIKVEDMNEINYNADWYQSLDTERKRAVFKEAIYKCPYLSDHMKISKIKASNDEFVNHYTFKMMLDVLSGK